MQNIFAVIVLCVTSFFINTTNTYVLLAANLEDFKSMAKKFIPEKLAVQLAEMAAASAVKYRQEKAYDDEKKKVEDAEEMEDENDTDTVPYLVRNSNINDNRARDKLRLPSSLAFENLVQKVKERIKDDLLRNMKLKDKKYQEKELDNSVTAPDYKGVQDNKRQKYFVNPKHRFKKVTKLKNSNNKADRFPKKDKYYEIDAKSAFTRYDVSKNEQNVSPSNNDRYDNADYAAVNQPNEDGMILAKIPILKNDSYEDYVTPEKERNVYESKERKVIDKVYTLETTQIEAVPLAKGIDTGSERDNEYEVEEIKARTEDLWYDYKEINVTHTAQNARDQTTPLASEMRKGTIIPKRDIVYKMSTPDYVKKQPVVAEKYDFNEPLPEKDREPENLKPTLGIQPFAINGKIKLK